LKERERGALKKWLLRPMNTKNLPFDSFRWHHETKYEDYKLKIYIKMFSSREHNLMVVLVFHKIHLRCLRSSEKNVVFEVFPVVLQPIWTISCMPFS